MKEEEDRHEKERPKGLLPTGRIVVTQVNS